MRVLLPRSSSTNNNVHYWHAEAKTRTFPSFPVCPDPSKPPAQYSASRPLRAASVASSRGRKCASDVSPDASSCYRRHGVACRRPSSGPRKILPAAINREGGTLCFKAGDIKLLESLDLSFNDLEGQVPVQGVFANASVISLAGNKKLCGGIPQ
uniref:Leucine-rich repeat-containing N-terminal plant-type domain-containing protein n=1 Tax=Salix viminalis TaxID=40686 RepID=A0A6N2M2H4_SALVM